MNERCKVVVGIDPSMTRVGLALCAWPVRDNGGDYIPFTQKGQVLARAHLAPLDKDSGPLWFRATEAVRRVNLMVRSWRVLAEAATGQPAFDAIVMEDPTDQKHIGRGEFRSPASIAVLAALVGTFYPTVRVWADEPTLTEEVALVPAGEWIPKTRGKRGWHPMATGQRERFVRNEFAPDAFPAGKRGGTDHDVLAAAGVARWYAIRRWSINEAERLIATAHKVNPGRVAE